MSEKRSEGPDLLTPDDVAEEIHPLHYAAAMGDKKTLGLLLQQQNDPKATVFARDAFGRTALVYAVVSGKQVCAEILVKAGADVNAVDNEGRTALHWAAFHQQVKMVKLLLAFNADPFALDSEQRLCLHLCVGNQTSKIFLMLAKAMGSRLDVNRQDKWGMTPLHWAAYHASLDHVKLLVKCNALTNIADREGKTPFHWVASSDNVEVARILLAAASRDGSQPQVINLQDSDGRSPLHLAVANGDLKMVTFLMQGGANVLLQDTQLRTPLHWAAHVGQLGILTRLLLAGTEQYYRFDASQASALIYAAVEGRADCVSALLSIPEIRDVPDAVGRTALMASTSRADESTVKALLEHCRSGQVNILAADSVGTTALHSCAYYGHAKIISLLLRAGAQVDAIDSHGYPPVFYSCEMGHADVLSVLLGARARVDFVDEEGRTLLHWATAGGHVAVCERLLESKQLNPDVPDQGGRTALHTAAYLGSAPLVQLLISRGASANTRDKMGISALHWAASTGSMPCVQALIGNGRAFPNHMEFHPARLTPLDYAVMAQHQDIATFLRDNGALTIAEVKDLASTHIQSWWKGYRARTELTGLWQRILAKANKKDASKHEQKSPEPVEKVKEKEKPAVKEKEKEKEKVVAVQKETPKEAPPPKEQPHKENVKDTPSKEKEKEITLALPPLKRGGEKKSIKQAPATTLTDIMYKPNINHTQMKDVLSAHRGKKPSEKLPQLGSPSPAPAARGSLTSSTTSPPPPAVAAIAAPVAASPPKAASPPPPPAAVEQEQIKELPPPPLPQPTQAPSHPVSPRVSRPSTPERLPPLERLAAPSPLVMERANMTRELRQLEARRREDIRTKVRAAVAIQRAWRRHLERKGRRHASKMGRGRHPASSKPTPELVVQSPLPLPPPSAASLMPPRAPISFAQTPLSMARASPRPPPARDLAHIDPSDPKQQIAALTIQLAWRRYARRLAIRARAHRGLAMIFARRARRRVQQQQAYAPVPVVEQWRPVLAPAVRPAEFNLPSLAITSFNMAFDTYLTPLMHPQQRMADRRQRLEAISRRAQSLREQIMEMRGYGGGGGDEDDDECPSPDRTSPVNDLLALSPNRRAVEV